MTRIGTVNQLLAAISIFPVDGVVFVDDSTGDLFVRMVPFNEDNNAGEAE
jgi:hypothetical protein